MNRDEIYIKHFYKALSIYTLCSLHNTYDIIYVYVPPFYTQAVNLRESNFCLTKRCSAGARDAAIPIWLKISQRIHYTFIFLTHFAETFFILFFEIIVLYFGLMQYRFVCLRTFFYVYKAKTYIEMSCAHTAKRSFCAYSTHAHQKCNVFFFLNNFR